MEFGFVVNDIDLVNQLGWWLQFNGLFLQFYGCKDIFFEFEELIFFDFYQGGKIIVIWDIYVLFQDYFQIVIIVCFNFQDFFDVQFD